MTNTTSLPFWDSLREQRWDDHRLYHHSRINQSLHLVSAFCFLSSYVLIFFSPVAAACIGWFGAMATRQIGHFFFEPKGYDEINHATHAHKESIKIGYNLRRKVILITAFLLAPAVVWLSPTVFGLFASPATGYDSFHNICVLWLILGAVAVVGRVAYLSCVQSPRVGLVWFAKILTDPFHDIAIYHRSPIYLLRGQKLDPMTDNWGTPASGSGFLPNPGKTAPDLAPKPPTPS